MTKRASTRYPSYRQERRNGKGRATQGIYCSNSGLPVLLWGQREYGRHYSSKLGQRINAADYIKPKQTLQFKTNLYPNIFEATKVGQDSLPCCASYFRNCTIHDLVFVVNNDRAHAITITARVSVVVMSKAIFLENPLPTALPFCCI